MAGSPDKRRVACSVAGNAQEKASFCTRINTARSVFCGSLSMLPGERAHRIVHFRISQPLVLVLFGIVALSEKPFIFAVRIGRPMKSGDSNEPLRSVQSRGRQWGFPRHGFALRAGVGVRNFPINARSGNWRPPRARSASPSSGSQRIRWIFSGQTAQKLS